MPIAYTDKINKRSLGSEQQINLEGHVIGITGINTVTPNEIRLLEVPFLESPSTVVIGGLNEVTTTPGTNEFKVDYTNGRILFHSDRNGEPHAVSYKGRGSIIDAEDINELQQVFVGSVTPGSPTIGIANLDGTLSAGIVRPNNISTVVTDDFEFPRHVVVIGDLEVRGTTTSLKTETVEIDDNKLLLNSNITGVPSEDAGLEIERGTSPNVEFIWNETNDSWQFKGTSGSTLFEIQDNGTIASLNNEGFTILGLSSEVDPASISVAIVDTKTGVSISTTVAISVTLPTPTTATLGRFFTVLHDSGSSGTLLVDGSNIGVGKGSTFMWDGSAWIPVGTTGGFEVVTNDPGSPVKGDSWFNDTDDQFKGYNGNNVVILG